MEPHIQARDQSPHFQQKCRTCLLRGVWYVRNADAWMIPLSYPDDRSHFITSFIKVKDQVVTDVNNTFLGLFNVYSRIWENYSHQY